RTLLQKPTVCAARTRCTDLTTVADRRPKVPILTTTPLTVDVGAPCPMCTHLHAVRRRLITRRFG
ncbi:hypothetical protein VDG43_20920, partial [Xanthomonas campestris pv. raphani]|uniref:hypothetical protein n=1 Tax=Xanthomonas campestris TaxID=339 RepID=UPI002B22B92C